MKQILSAAVLFILLILTIVALNKFDAPKANASAATGAKTNVTAPRPQ